MVYFSFAICKSIRGQVIRQGKKILKEEKEQIDQELIKALRQTEDELTKEADGGIIYLEVDGTNIYGLPPIIRTLS